MEQDLKQKQIEELSKDLQYAGFYASDECGATECKNCKYNGKLNCGDMLSAEHLIEKGYRKIPENIDWLDGYKQGFKEGVQAVQIQLKEYVIDDFTEYDYGYLCMRLDEICKKLTEG